MKATAFAITTALAMMFGAVSAGANEAADILRVAGVRGGLIIHIDCGDGALTTALHANDRFLVQGLDTDAARVARVRRALQAAHKHGPITVEVFDGKHLPYVDNLVDLIVAGAPPTVPGGELMRVLRPGGVLCVKRDNQWTRTVKPWPDELDQWTHFLHDASNNPVAADQRVGPPRGLQWTCGPLWARSHEFASSLAAMVSGQGRLFYVFDEGLTSITDPPIPERWTLIARDAFNGVLLWKRRLPQWGTAVWNRRALRSVPATVPRQLVVAGARVYVTLAYRGAVSVLDAATGDIVSTLPSTAGTEEIRYCNGVLLLRSEKHQLQAIDCATERQLWSVSGRIQPLTLAAQGERVVYQDGPQLVCVNLRDGSRIWRVASKRPIALLVMADTHIFIAAGKQLQAIAADTGKTEWSVNSELGRREMFVAQGRLWHWQGAQTIVGRDIHTGEITARPDTSDVFTLGHHLRCYQSKATENFLITPNRGAEFVSIAGGVNTENDWLRAACRYGVVPANGLLYNSPHPCMCYPGVMVKGFNAFSPAVDLSGMEIDSRSATRLERGPAYDQVSVTGGSSGGSVKSDWPTYRHDERRSGYTPVATSIGVPTRWQVRVPGRLTPPVAAGGRLFVASRDAQTLYALDATDGSVLWQYAAGGRIDSPPTLAGTCVLFGAADGWVYCLHARDGQLAWRFRAAPIDRRVVASNRLESPWPSHGSLLLHEGLVYCTAGRSSYLDGGIWIHALDPKSGAVVYETRVDTWSRTRRDAVGKPFIPGYHIEGTQSDILVSQDGAIYLEQLKFDRTLKRENVPYVLPDKSHPTKAINLVGKPYFEPDRDANGKYEQRQREWLERTQKNVVAKLRQAYGGFSLGDRKMGLHVFSPAGFLDDSWFNRTYWMYSATWPGYYLAHRAAKTGQLLVAGPKRTYAVQAFPTRNFQSPMFTPGKQGYLLFADRNETEPVLDDATRGTPKGWGFTRKAPPVWFHWVPIRVRAMVLAGQRLYVIGPPDQLDADDPMASFEGRLGSVLHVYSAADGKLLATRQLDVAPVFDGLIAASGQLFLCTTDGQVLALGGAEL